MRNQGLQATLLMALLLSSGVSGAAVIHAASCKEKDVRRAILSTVSGDTVLIPGPCSATWPTSVTVDSSRAITLASSGGTVSIAGATALTIDQNASRSTRVTGLTFVTIGGSGNPTIRTAGRFSPPSAMARIDHNEFRGTSTGTWIETDGAAPVLIDHNSLSAGGAAEMIHNVAFGPERGTITGWSTDVVPGSADMVFIEDNIFTCTDRSYICNVVQSYYGARTVVRHNISNFSQVDQHGTPGLPWARWWEIYQNTFYSLGRPQCCYLALRGGTGVVWGNTHPDVNGVGAGFGVFVEAPDCSGHYPSPGYPAPDQIGRGINQAASPAYFWDNAPDMPVVQGEGGGCLEKGVDYFIASQQPVKLQRCESAADRRSGCPVSYTYVPYVYPFPLNPRGLPEPAGSGRPAKARTGSRPPGVAFRERGM